MITRRYPFLGVIAGWRLEADHVMDFCCWSDHEWHHHSVAYWVATMISPSKEEMGPSIHAMAAERHARAKLTPASALKVGRGLES